MVAMFEGVLVGTIVLIVFHFLVALWARSVRREALEKEFAASPAAVDRDAFIAAGMRAYRKSLRYRLLFVIYLIPVAAIVVITTVVNNS